MSNNHPNNRILLGTYSVGQGAETHFLHVTPHKPCGVVVTITPILELGKLRASKVKSLTQGRVATKRQRWDLNAD